jgi:hypothetical protein
MPGHLSHPLPSGLDSPTQGPILRRSESRRASRTAPCQSHTHVQQVAGCLHVDTRGGDGPRPWHPGKDRPQAPRRSRTGRDVSKGPGVPATGSKWATWKRYCDLAGISMGRAIVTLIDREMVSVVGYHTGDHPTACRVRSEDVCSTQRGGDQGRSQRTLPVRIRPQVQRLPRPARPIGRRPAR